MPGGHQPHGTSYLRGLPVNPAGHSGGGERTNPAGAFLDHRQARLSQRLQERPAGGGGPGEILGRRAELAARPKRVTGVGKEAFDAELYAIMQTMGALLKRKSRGKTTPFSPASWQPLIEFVRINPDLARHWQRQSYSSRKSLSNEGARSPSGRPRHTKGYDRWKRDNRHLRQVGCRRLHRLGGQGLPSRALLT